jgi:predicted RNA-binding Zn-ribbon protein involved in translation (DUF1610 family)
MAVHTRVLIESKDILGVEFECPHCGATILYPLDKSYQRIAEACPGCSQSWFAPNNPAAHPSTPTVAKQVLEGLANFQKLLNRTDIHARIRVQVNGLSKE